jgi:hypothetical protein
MLDKASTISAPRRNAGCFRKGDDARRHKLTREECQRGFWAALESICERYPHAVTSYHAHISINFLPSTLKKRRIS